MGTLLYAHRLDVSFKIGSEVGLGIIWNTPELPGESCSVGSKAWSGQEPLVVVPVSNDMDSTGQDDHPGYGLVEGEVLVQETFDSTRWTLQGGGGGGGGVKEKYDYIII